MDLKHARSLVEPEGSKGRTQLHELLAHIEQTPKDHTVKGMYVAGILDTLKAHHVSCKLTTVQAFKDYPLREYMELLLDSAVTLYPRQAPADGLRELGRLAIPTFAKSIVGGVIMGTVGRSWELALKCVAKGYEVSLRPGRCTVTAMSPGGAVLQLRSVWNFGTSYQVGVIQGLMDWCQMSGHVTPAALSPCNVDLRLEWEEKRAGRRRPGASASVAPPPM